MRQAGLGTAVLLVSWARLELALCTLLFREDSVLQLNLGFTLDWMNYAVGTLTTNYYYQLQYLLPYNATELRQPPTVSSRGRRDSRLRTYERLESALDDQQVDGHACLLKSICEVAEVPLHTGQPGLLLEEVLHILLTPSEDLEEDPCNECHPRQDEGGASVNEFLAAERLGRHAGDCERAFPHCSLSPLVLFTKLVTV